MKLKEIFYLIGMKPKERKFGHRIDRIQLAQEGEIECANWEHPKCERLSVTQAEVDGLRKFLKAGDTAIDIGAHFGDTAVPVAIAVGGDGCVFAFEPNPNVFEVLEVNAGLNPGKMRIVTLPYAATADTCKLTFTYSDAGLCNGGEHRGVSRWRHAHAFELEVDGLNAEKLLRNQYPDEIQKLKYVKTDAEGADLMVLQSIVGLIKEFHPYIRSEVYKHTTPMERRELFQFFLDLDYSIFEFESSESLQGRPMGLDDVMHSEHYDIFAVPPESDRAPSDPGS